MFISRVKINKLHEKNSNINNLTWELINCKIKDSLFLRKIKNLILGKPNNALKLLKT